MTFAEQFTEYNHWKNSVQDTPDAYEEWLELTEKADKWDEYEDVIVAIRQEIAEGSDWTRVGHMLSDFDHYFRERAVDSF